MTYTEYRVELTSSDGEEFTEYVGKSLEEAIRTWDYQTYRLPPKEGGIRVLTRGSELPYPVLRDGWILHQHEDGSVYLNPHLSER